MYSEIDGLKNEHIWLLWSSDKALVEMTEELDKLLHEQTWHAQSVTSKSGRLILTLAAS